MDFRNIYKAFFEFNIYFECEILPQILLCTVFKNNNSFYKQKCCKFFFVDKQSLTHKFKTILIVNIIIIKLSWRNHLNFHVREKKKRIYMLYFNILKSRRECYAFQNIKQIISLNIALNSKLRCYFNNFKFNIANSSISIILFHTGHLIHFHAIYVLFFTFRSIKRI